MSSIFCVYPDDQTTRFLNKLQMRLKNSYGSGFHCYKVKPNLRSHSNCLLALVEREENDLILFIGHGRSDYLYGSKGRSSDAFISHIEDENMPDIFFKKDRFIDKTNISIFYRKKVICLSCNSRDYLGTWSVQAGAKVFIGFGDIPTDSVILKEIGRPLPTLIARFKGEVNWIITKSITVAIEQNMTFHEFVDTLKYFVNRRIKDILVVHKNLKHKELLTDYLFKFKDEIKLFGNGNLKVLDS